MNMHSQTGIVFNVIYNTGKLFGKNPTEFNHQEEAHCCRGNDALTIVKHWVDMGTKLNSRHVSRNCDLECWIVTAALPQGPAELGILEL